jgi:hypothetical protein
MRDKLLTASDPLQRRRSIMVEFMLTIIGFAGAMTVPAFLTAILESTASKTGPRPCEPPRREAADEIRRRGRQDTPIASFLRAVQRADRGATCVILQPVSPIAITNATPRSGELPWWRSKNMRGHHDDNRRIAISGKRVAIW